MLQSHGREKRQIGATQDVISCGRLGWPRLPAVRGCSPDDCCNATHEPGEAAGLSASYLGIRRAQRDPMPGRALLCLALLSAPGAAAVASEFLLGADSANGLPRTRGKLRRTAPAHFTFVGLPDLPITASILGNKTVRADGKTILRQNQPGFPVTATAVVLDERLQGVH